jgi:signal transduction histidine kinase
VIVNVDADGPGLGLDPEALFAPFHRGMHSAGPGLGLAIARRVAHAHGGELFGGRSARGGARFQLRLPRLP